MMFNEKIDENQIIQHHSTLFNIIIKQNPTIWACWINIYTEPEIVEFSLLKDALWKRRRYTLFFFL